MVADYTCLWWGSANEMYDNRCGVEAQVRTAVPYRTAPPRPGGARVTIYGGALFFGANYQKLLPCFL